jgi:hypothetical protein
MPLTRRELIRSAAGAGALLVAAPRVLSGALAGVPGVAGAARRSRLFPGQGLLVHADLHNHSLHSDGAGRAEEAFGQMRTAGLDVAALTDHAIMGKLGMGAACMSNSQCNTVVGIDEESWQQLKGLADGANTDGAFVAMRGFEWTTNSLGHINVWFSEKWTDAATVGALFEPKDAPGIAQVVPVPIDLDETLGPALGPLPRSTDLKGFYEWLASPTDRPVLGGGNDALAGFNHPVQYGDFERFSYVPAVADRLVSVEAFNFANESTTGDYLYEGTETGDASPLGRCLDAGWRTGMLGVSDEHSANYGRKNQARAGLYVNELSRAGVREALLARRFFATRVQGLRLDAAANGARMGSTLTHRTGRVRVVWDLEADASWTGRTLVAQVLRSGSPMPEVVAQRAFAVGGRKLPYLDLDHRIDDGSWLLLRITDPVAAADPRATGVFAASGDAIAYASPFFLQP